MAFRRRRVTRRRRRINFRRRTARSFRRRGRRTGSLRRAVKRLYKINEVKQTRTIFAGLWVPERIDGAQQNVLQYPVILPSRMGSTLNGEPFVLNSPDSVYVGNTFQPVSLRLFHNITFTGAPRSTDALAYIRPTATNLTVRIIVFQVKGGRGAASYLINDGTYHELGRLCDFNTSVQDTNGMKARMLATSNTTQFVTFPAATNYLNECVTPFRTGIRGLCTILSDRKFRFNSNGTTNRACKYYTRRPRQVTFIEHADGDVGVEINPSPVNAIYVMCIFTPDGGVISDFIGGQSTPIKASISTQVELKYRDA